MDIIFSNTEPLVTILICNYNYGRYLGEAIESALAQTWKNIEIIVVDDGSTDESREVLEKYEGKIQVILKENGGQASAFNVGICEAKGEIVCFLDSDDLCHPNRVSSIIEKYRQGHRGLVCHDLDIIDGTGNSIGKKQTEYAGINLAEGKQMDIVFNHDYAWLFSPTSGMSLPISLARKIFPLPCEKWRISADEPLAFHAACLEPFGNLKESLGSYRLHNNNLFANFHEDPNARHIASITHKTRRYFLCKEICSDFKVSLPSPKNSYIFYRRCCLIAREKPYRFIPMLLKKNIEHHIQRENLWLMSIKIPAFFAADLFIILKRMFLKSSKHNLLKAKFDHEARNIEEDQLKYILFDDQ